MPGIAEHKKKIKEHEEELQDAINIGIEKRPSTIGFHAVACSLALLELYLHIKSLISTGKMLKHNWFRRPKEGQKSLPLVERKLPVNFPDKEKIYEMLFTLEDNRDALVYGKASKIQIELVINTFMRLKSLMEKKLEEEGETLE